MKKSIYRQAILLPFLAFLVAGLAGCSVDKGNPEIANLVYIPQKAPVEEGKTANIIGTINVLRESGETASVNTVVLDETGKQLAAGSLPVSGGTGGATNALGFGLSIDISRKGDYLFQVYVVDSKGRQSNRLDGTFRVTDVF